MSLTANPNADNEIVRVARDLCETFHIRRFQPLSVRWVTWLLVPHNKMIMPSDQCFFEDNNVALQKALKDSLSVEDWKPLIASSLIYEFDPGIQRRLSILRPLRFAAILFVVLSSMVVARFLLPAIFLSSSVSLGLFVGELFVLNLLFWDFSVSRRKLRLASDRKAAKVLGRDVFLSTLRKIDAKMLGDVEARKLEKRSGWTLGRSQWPSITQRIEALHG